MQKTNNSLQVYRRPPSPLPETPLSKADKFTLHQRKRNNGFSVESEEKTYTDYIRNHTG